jgi:hypothetical protein
VVRQIADRHIVAFVEARQPGIDLPGQMLLGASGEKAGTQRLQRAIVRNTQRRGIVLPLTAEEGMEQGFQLHRGQLRQLQRVLLLTVVQRLLHHLVAQTFRRFVK